jgi:hypothetical protein
MNLHIKLFFRILFLVAFFFCFGINAYSNDKAEPCSVGFSLGTADFGHGFSSDLDSDNEDEITQSQEFYLLAKPLSLVIIPLNLFFIHHRCFSVWQPPKIS